MGGGGDNEIGQEVCKLGLEGGILQYGYVKMPVRFRFHHLRSSSWGHQVAAKGEHGCMVIKGCGPVACVQDGAAQ